MVFLRCVAFICWCTLVNSFGAYRYCRQPPVQRTDVLDRHTIRHVKVAAAALQSTCSDANLSEQLREHLKGTCIYLVGMMGSGKSTVGDSLAKKLLYRLLDTDVLAEYLIEMPIAQFFAEGRESEFREVEYQVLMQLSQYTRVVVATGGGIVVKKENWGLLHNGLVVYLDLAPEDIHQRLKANPAEVAKRPLLQAPDPLAKLQDLCAQRKDAYESADITVKVDPQHSPEETADRIMMALVEFIKQNPPRWQTWKAKREETALEVANMARENTRHKNEGSSKGFGKGGTGPSVPTGAISSTSTSTSTAERRGSITYVPMSDILSGKVQLPNANKALDGS